MGINDSILIYEIIKLKQALMLANQIIKEFNRDGKYDNTRTGIGEWKKSYSKTLKTVERLVSIHGKPRE